MAQRAYILSGSANSPAGSQPARRAEHVAPAQIHTCLATSSEFPDEIELEDLRKHLVLTERDPALSSLYSHDLLSTGMDQSQICVCCGGW
jgi:hypothetical protein